MGHVLPGGQGPGKGVRMYCSSLVVFPFVWWLIPRLMLRWFTLVITMVRDAVELPAPRKDRQRNCACTYLVVLSREVLVIEKVGGGG